ncbi:hypothetical protein P4O66_007454, partial [Electrophorus voltai]
MTASIRLFDLVNLSIGTPEIGAVNFNALHTLLHAILEHLKIQNVTAEWREPDEGHDPRGALATKTTLSGERPNIYHHMEDRLRHLENKINALERFPSGQELLSRTASGSTTSVNDMWQLMQLRRKVEANEEGVSKCMELMQDILKEMQELKETRDNMKKEVRVLQNQLNKIDLDNLADRISVVKQYFHKLEDLENSMREFKENMALYPHPEELSQCVTWEVMQATLVNDRQKIKELNDSITCNGLPVTPCEVSIPLTPRVSPTVDLHGVANSSGSTGPDLGGSHEVPLLQLPMSWISRGAERYPETVGALREIGQLQERHKRLEAHVEHLEGGKADQAQVQQLREMLSDMGMVLLPGQRHKEQGLYDLFCCLGERDMHANILEQVNCLKTLVDTVIADREKLGSLRSMLEDMMTSSSMLTWSLQQEMSDTNQGQQGETLTQGHCWGQGSLGGLSGQAGPTTPSSMVDMSRKSAELMSDVQGAILHLQVECEKLQSTTSQLMEANIQKQSHIDHLYKAMEKLEEKKADREVVETEIGIKADKRALETKVSRMQFDTMTEQLNGMFQELLSKVTGHEQDWHKVIEKISKEMESKLNRIELDPLKKQLEDRWRSINKQLQTQPAPIHDDAAGFRRQLLTRFHCISCDRPVDMLTPGPHLITLPSPPGFPSHKTNRPYTTHRCYSRLQHISHLMQTEEYSQAKSTPGLQVQCMALMQDLLKEIQELKETRDNLKKEVIALQNELNQIVDQFTDRISVVEQYFHQVEDLVNSMRELKEKVALYPHPEVFSQCVTWEVMQATLVNDRQKIKKELTNSITGTGPLVTPCEVSIPSTPRVSPTVDLHGMANSSGSTGPDLGGSHEVPLLQLPMSWISRGAEHYPETVDALREIGQLQERHKRLEARVEHLEGGKADQAHVQQLREILSDMGEKDMPENMLERVNHVKSLVDTVIADRKKSSELMSDVQGAILQLQVECEKLHSTTSQLMEAHLQKQSHINHLFKTMEELEEKKADREVVETEIGIKADKHALETKVSRMQFDTMTEQLNGMFQELLSKVTGHEQDWHKVIEKISKEMESKLNRIELDPLKKQLEDRWRSINKQLQTQPAPVHDDAAGFRRQLLARFHCISCDRPVDILTPGPHLVTLPSPPGLPSHKTNRPYTIYEMEQMRHHSRSERIPEMTEYGYLALSRSCGGSHTLTFANRRYSRLQHITHLIQTEEDSQVMSSPGLQVQQTTTRAKTGQAAISRKRAPVRTLVTGLFLGLRVPRHTAATQ